MPFPFPELHNIQNIIVSVIILLFSTCATNGQMNNLQVQFNECFSEKNVIHLPKKIYGINSSIAVPLWNLYLQFLTIMRRNGDNKSQKYTLNTLYSLLDIYSIINVINSVFSVNFLILHLKPRTCNQLILWRIIINHR